MWSIFRNDVACADQISHWHTNVPVPVHTLQGMTHSGLFFVLLMKQRHNAAKRLFSKGIN